MPVLTDLASAEIKRHVNILYGTILSRPMLLVADGTSTTYACDVNIGEMDPTGTINQYINEKNGKSTMLTGLPGQEPEDWQLEDSLPGHIDTTLHNVPIARNNADLIYAEVGAPVTLTRVSLAAMWEITGFAIEQPGTHKLYAVDLGDMSFGTVIDLTVTTRLLNLGEFGELEPFGSLAMGASAVFKGGELQYLT